MVRDFFLPSILAGEKGCFINLLRENSALSRGWDYKNYIKMLQKTERFKKGKYRYRYEKELGDMEQLTEQLSVTVFEEGVRKTSVKVWKMKLSNKAAEDVVATVAGEDVLPLVRALKNKKNVSEFKLAEALKLEINVVRNMLYRLQQANLVSFTRKKDKIKGWYIYYWTFKPKRIKYLLEDLKKKKLEGLKEKLERERVTHYFKCNNTCMRLGFEQAIDFEFKCPECGELMDQEDNSECIREIEEMIKRLETEA